MAELDTRFPALRACILSLMSCRHPPTTITLRPQTFFERMYMGKTSGLYGRAVDNFVRSLAGYAIVTYMLQVCAHAAQYFGHAVM